MSEEFTFRIEPLEEARTYRVTGPLDLPSAVHLTELLEDLCRTPGDVTLDLSQVTFMDSSGLRAVIDACRTLGDQGEVRLVSPSGQVRRLLELTRLDEGLPNLRVVDA